MLHLHVHFCRELESGLKGVGSPVQRLLRGLLNGSSSSSSSSVGASDEATTTTAAAAPGAVGSGAADISMEKQLKSLHEALHGASTATAPGDLLMMAFYILQVYSCCCGADIIFFAQML